MTPAAIQARVYVGLIPGSTQAECERIARDLIVARRRLLADTGWELCSRSGSAPPPVGAVLLGAVACNTEDECDVALYVYPATPAAMVLKDRCGQGLPS